MPRGTAAASSPQQRAENEAVQAHRKLESTKAQLVSAQERVVALQREAEERVAALQREVAYRTSLLTTTVQHPDLPQNFDIAAHVAALPEPEAVEAPKKRGRKSNAQKAAEAAEKAAQDATDAEAVADGTVNATQPTPPAADEDDPFAQLG